MSGKFAVFLLGCGATGALTFYFVKSDADKRIAGMQQALDNLTYASKREEQNHRKELAEMQARLSGPPKAKPADNWPPKGTRISRITGDGLLLETATGLTMVTWSEVPEELRHSYELQAKEAIASEAKQTTVSSIQVQTGVQLPASARVLDESSDPRSPGYYEWTLFSTGTGRIIMPHIRDSTGENYITNSLNVAIQMIEIKAKTNVARAEVAFTSYWDKGQYQFRGTVVRTVEGEYLHLERFFRIVNGKVEQKPQVEN
jgi:hypothetical protein